MRVRHLRIVGDELSAIDLPHIIEIADLSNNDFILDGYLSDCHPAVQNYLLLLNLRFEFTRATGRMTFGSQGY
jgi:hypothetical protein